MVLPSMAWVLELVITLKWRWGHIYTTMYRTAEQAA